MLCKNKAAVQFQAFGIFTVTPFFLSLFSFFVIMGGTAVFGSVRICGYAIDDIVGTNASGT